MKTPNLFKPSIEFAVKRAKTLTLEQLKQLPSPTKIEKSFYDWYMNYLQEANDREEIVRLTK